MELKRRHHFEWNEIKKGIIEFILTTDVPVSEPIVRDFLQRKYGEQKKDGKFDRSTVNKHLLSLRKSVCIESVKHEGKFIFYDIKTLENLKKILCESPGIKLNEYSKPLFIVLCHNNLAKILENGQINLSIAGLDFYIRLLLSSSFFRACIDTDVKTLNKRALAIHMYKDTYETIRIEDSLNESYNVYKKLYQNFELSFESFESMMREMVHKKDEITSLEMFMEVWEKELLGLSKEESNEMHQGSMEDYLKLFWEMRRTTIWISEREQMSEIFRLDLLFEAYFYQDVLKDDASDEEKNFAIKTNASHEEFINSHEDDGLNEEISYYEKSAERLIQHYKRSRLADDMISDNKKREEQKVLMNLEQISIVMANHKHPMIFDKEIYNDPKAIFDKLKEAFSCHSD